MALSEALPLANSVVELVRGVTRRAEIAGSIRRCKAEVKDIEIVVIVDDYQALFNDLSKVGMFIKPGVPDVQPWPPKIGAKYIRMLLHDKIKLDLFVATSDNWGGIYMMRTGSAVGPNGAAFTGFVPMMFSRWKKLSGGGKMIGGQPSLPDGQLLAVPEEQDMFDLCKVKFIPPQERVSSSVIKMYKTE